MPATPPSQRMGELHEIHLAEVFAGTKTKSSGNQWSDPADGKNHADLPWPFRWDGKSTRGKQVAVTLDMITKIREQAGTRLPALGLRWYGNETLTDVTEDWVAVPADVFGDLLDTARRGAAGVSELNSARAESARLAEYTRVCEDRIERLTEELSQARRDPYLPRQVPPHIPALPWTLIATSGGIISAIHYAADGAMSPVSVQELRVEHGAGHDSRPRIFLNGIKAARGSLYRDGLLVALAWQDHPELEIG